MAATDPSSRTAVEMDSVHDAASGQELTAVRIVSELLATTITASTTCTGGSPVMPIKNRSAVTGIIVIVFAVAALLTGCSSSGENSGSGGSRVKFYSSVSELARDSAIVITGTVTQQRTATDVDPVTLFTISTVTVIAAIKGASLVAGSAVEVRQLGSANQVGPAPAPLLAVGSAYLLYLTASGLSGALASQYYVTGSDAGLYEAPSPSVAANGKTLFAQMKSDRGDSLPTAITLDKALG
jgi:hypothetical protein